MNNENRQNQVTAIRNQCLSKSGYLFNIENSHWKLDKNTKIAVKPISDLLKDSTGYLSTLSFYAQNYSATHTKNINERFLHMLRTTDTNAVNEIALINYRANLGEDTEWYLGTIRGFFRKWYELGYFGISEEVIELLDSWSLKGNIKGDVVKRLDPLTGPLSDNELQGFNEGAVSAYEQNKITLAELAMGLSVSNTGRRPIQISYLKIKDILEGKNKKGEIIHLLNIPRAKQRATEFRGEFKQFAITNELWVILSEHAKQTIDHIERILGFELQAPDRLELPLFPDDTTISAVDSPKKLRDLQGFDKLHIAAQTISSTTKKIVEMAEVNSERTGELLNISANRFRYTVGTRAAREGFGIMTIAELLDHSDNQNAGVYIENIPDHVEKLDQAVGQYLAPYAQAFAGVLIDSEKDAKRGNELNSRVKVDGEDVGSCGSYGFCGANIPVPCYTCTHFQPWLDGPHQIVFDELISERTRLFEVTGDKQIAAVNDRSIFAVAEVIRRCEIRREELNNG
jgi:integrase